MWPLTAIVSSTQTDSIERTGAYTLARARASAVRLALVFLALCMAGCLPSRITLDLAPQTGKLKETVVAGTNNGPKVVLIDVTGHGLTAALTVNRIAGEIEREFGVDPDASPASILTGLNNYIHHTLALHSVYATALALRIDTDAGTVLWASAGHPPGFLRAVNGTIDRLESTALVLGACLGDDFVVEELTHRFGPGDALLIYTDGATEAMDEQRKMLGVRGLETILANGQPEAHGGWSATIMQEVKAHRAGPADDDTLLVEIYRPLRTS